MTLNGLDVTRTSPDAFEAFLSTLGERDRRNFRNHLTACEAEDDSRRATLWKRLACFLGSLAGKPARTTGKRAVQFFVADGHYLMQMFALEDPHDGTVAVYTPDALEAAVASGVLRGPVGAEGDALFYEAGGLPGINLKIEVLSAAKTVDAPEYYRHLLGWKRRALKVTLPAAASPAQIQACEALCRLAARQVTDGLHAAPKAPAAALRH